MSLPEVLLWRQVRAGAFGCHQIRRQHPEGPYVLDFYCHGARLCIEVDGQSHVLRREHDQRRDDYLAERGIRTIRLQARLVLSDMDTAVRTIHHALAGNDEFTD